MFTRMVIIIIPMVIAILIFLGILKVINKFIFKNKVKINLKEIIIGWLIIFFFNLFCITFNVPYPIGITYSPFYDGGQTKYCVSLGYVIKIKRSGIIFATEEEAKNATTEVKFLTLNEF